VLVDVDMPKLRVKLLVLLGQEPDCLAVVAMNNQLMAGIESKVSEETLPPVCLFCCLGKSQQFSFGAGGSDRFLLRRLPVDRSSE
jgi:hypothetical protein